MDGAKEIYAGNGLVKFEVKVYSMQIKCSMLSGIFESLIFSDKQRNFHLRMLTFLAPMCIINQI